MSRFAAIESRANAAVMRTLANTMVTLNGVPDVPAIVNAGMQNETFELPGPAGFTPVVTLSASAVPAGVTGLPIVIQSGIAAGTYTVGVQEPDGTGLITLYLHKP